MHASKPTAALAVITVSVCLGSVQARDLTIEERVQARAAVEKVYWSHRSWPADNPAAKPPLSQSMPDAAIRARVEDTLRKGEALQKLWHRPITAAQLQAEMDRMAKGTKEPRMLRELFAALGDDPLLIADTLARPTLADRLIRNAYARDVRFHGELKSKAEDARETCGSVACMRSMGGTYHEARWKTAQAPSGVDELVLGQMSRVQETAQSFGVAVVLSRNDDEVIVASVTWPKISFDAWWTTARSGFDARVEPTSHAFTLPRVPTSSCTEDTWSKTAIDVPDARTQFAAVWTGSEMIVFGGYSHPQHLFDTGGRYDPATDTWTDITITNAPSQRQSATAAWTGTEMVVWGGKDVDGNFLATGARYNPATNTWASTSTGTGVPSARWKHTAVWTGTVMIVWGGAGSATVNTGSRYNPVTDSWTATTNTGAPSRRDSHTAIWTGSVMIVWGGSSLNTGGRYNPATNSWAATSTGTNVPSGRSDHTAIWTGTEMIVFGGPPPRADPGGRYNPATNTWATVSTVESPSTRTHHSAVWTGAEMIVWGGQATNNTGGRYNPATDTWTPTSTGPGVPAPRSDHRAFWTGTEMLVWGGTDGVGMNTGGRYDPSTDTWVPTAGESGMPSARQYAASVWTGAEMIVWGGSGIDSFYLGTGGRYDPATDTWAPTSSANAPTPRVAPTAVWTGSRMILWGGQGDDGYPQDGARYDPLGDTWTPTSIGASTPMGRAAHGAVWTGTEMIVWGGYADGFVNTGGRYDPATDSWTPTSVGANVPAPRWYFGTVWTGSRLVVWGGQGDAGVLNTGGRYDPATDSWTPTSTGANVPAPRIAPSAVWAGTSMIVWGGADVTVVATGGRYDPVGDTWTAVSTSGAPSARQLHTALWTGKEMIVWGGANDVPQGTNTGGRYDPATNAWTSTLVGGDVPSTRWADATQWTGDRMIVWGGFPETATGGLYCACPNGVLAFRDADGDGYGDSGVTLASCDGSIAPGYVADGTDCNDHAASAHPGGVEVCDGLDNDCNGGVDDGIAPPSGTATVAAAKSGSDAFLSWAPIAGASTYDAVEGSLTLLASSGGDFQAATTACIANDTASTSATSTTSPSPGDGVWIVVRGGNCAGAGSYDEGGISQIGSRDAEIAGSGAACP
jgi:N-acetylneuraminic acid mutarotase